MPKLTLWARRIPPSVAKARPILNQKHSFKSPYVVVESGCMYVCSLPFACVTLCTRCCMPRDHRRMLASRKPSGTQCHIHHISCVVLFDPFYFAFRQQAFVFPTSGMVWFCRDLGISTGFWSRFSAAVLSQRSFFFFCNFKFPFFFFA